MKKPLAALLLISGSIILTLGLGYCVFLLFLELLGWSAFLSVLILTLHIIGAVFLQVALERREWLSPVKFYLCAAIPPVICSTAGFGIVLYLEGIGYFTGFFAGLREILGTLCCLIYSDAFLVISGAALLIKRLIRRKIPLNNRNKG